MRVSEIMIKNPVNSTSDTPVIEITKIMRENSISSIILIDNEKPIGIITERDLVHRILATSKNPKITLASEIASKPVVAVSHFMDVEAAVSLMNDYNIRRIVVDDKDKVVGILTSDDICRNLQRLSEEVAAKLISISYRKRS